MVTEKEIKELVKAVLPVEIGDNSVLFGRGQVIDSHGFVTFIMDLEVELEKRYQVQVNLLDEELLREHPFGTVGSTVEWLNGFLND